MLRGATLGDARRIVYAAIAHDLPAGEWRRIQKAEGYHYTLVGGEVTFEGDRCTGATPGRLIRHGRA